MRKLIYPMNTSLDCYVEGTDGNFEWSEPDAELHKHFNDLIAVATTHLHGRRMWETMSSFWPNAEADPEATPVTKEFARYWNAAEHIVFSRSLPAVDHGARLVRDNAAIEVGKRQRYDRRWTDACLNVYRGRGRRRDSGAHPPSGGRGR